MVMMKVTDPYESSSVDIIYVFIALYSVQFNLDHSCGEIKTSSTMDFDEIKQCSVVW